MFDLTNLSDFSAGHLIQTIQDNTKVSVLILFLVILVFCLFLKPKWVTKTIDKIWAMFIWLFQKIYFRYYPLRKEMGNNIFFNHRNHNGKCENASNQDSTNELRQNVKFNKWVEDEKKGLNEIRIKNIVGAIFSQSGAIIALMIAIISFFISYLGGTINYKWIGLVVVFISFLAITPIVLRNVLDHLGPEEYAEISIGDLNREELLKFLALKNWNLLFSFLESLFPEKKDLETIIWELKHAFEPENYLSCKMRNLSDIEDYASKIREFRQSNFKEIQKCIFLIRGSFEKLGIHKRELTHHVLQFSPAIFYEDIHFILHYLDTAVHLSKMETDLAKRDEIFEEYSRDLNYLIRDIILRRLETLEQLILFDNIHKYIIGLSSITSTSLSFKIFIRGLSDIASDCDGDKVKYKSVLALLHRSKAHCGVDLLILLENFVVKYLVNEPKSQKLHLDVLEAIYKVKYSGDTFSLYNSKYLQALEKLRYIFMVNTKSSKDSISNNFSNVFKQWISFSPNSGMRYIVVFGYSDAVKRCLRQNIASLKNDNIQVFIFQDSADKSLDTRMFRYELNKKYTKGGFGRVFKSFTAKDDFFKSLVNSEDRILFLVGAEAFDLKRKHLLHTNKYQSRVQSFFDYFDKPNQNTGFTPKDKPQIWVLAEEYKLYDEYPPLASIFGSQFYRDFYETLDLYDLNGYNDGKRLYVISDEKIYSNTDATGLDHDHFVYDRNV